MTASFGLPATPARVACNPARAVAGSAAPARAARFDTGRSRAMLASMKSGPITRRASGLMRALACAVLCAGCGDDETARSGRGYRVEIRQTSYGIPHVLADDIPSAVAGLGYVGARDYGCILLDQIVRVRSERAKF